MSKDKTTCTYLEKLERIFSSLDEDTTDIIQPLIENAAFMAEQMDDLREYIAVNGWTEEYQNGQNQWGKKKSSEGDTYQQLVKNFNATIKQLKEFLPDNASGGDELEEFLKRR